MFYDFYVNLCERVRISPSRAATEIGINKSSVTYWKNKGATPSMDILVRIAAYFDADLSQWGVKPEPLPPVDTVIAPEREYSDTAKGLSYLTGVLEQEFRLEHPQLLEPSETLGSRIRRLRRSRRLSLEETAKLVGSDIKTFEAWESDRLPIRNYRLQKIADVLGVPIETLNPTTLTDGGALTREGLYAIVNVLKNRPELIELVAAAKDAASEDIEAAIHFFK